jgi:hypothetical protein
MEANCLPTDGCLRMIGRNTGPKDTVLAGGVDLKGSPKSHRDFGLEHMLSRPVCVNGEASLEGESGVVLQGAAVDGSDNSRRVTAARRDGDRGEGTEQLIGALVSTAVDCVHKPERQAA